MRLPVRADVDAVDEGAQELLDGVAGAFSDGFSDGGPDGVQFVAAGQGGCGGGELDGELVAVGVEFVAAGG
ncbi:MAG TPA: hypothetical protein VNG13_04020 [Mycobacteriales bacterium]|nr:hypothetical protein [Mycobacteriales bacterium]